MTAEPTFGLALFSAALLGLRHGFDHDHVAAITDITTVQKTPGRAMKLGLLYALGHAATVALLGAAVILFQLSLPARADVWMERVVGISLLVLGAYVSWTALIPGRHKHTHGPGTRIALLANAMLWVVWRLRGVFGRVPSERPRLFADGIGKAPAVLVGIVHGLGAETPTQVLLFLLAVNLGGPAKGLLGLATFIAGMIAMNTLMCAVAAGVLRVSSSRPRALQWAAGLSAAYSILVGAIYLLGPAAVLAMVQ